MGVCFCSMCECVLSFNKEDLSLCSTCVPLVRVCATIVRARDPHGRACGVRYNALTCLHVDFGACVRTRGAYRIATRHTQPDAEHRVSGGRAVRLVFKNTALDGFDHLAKNGKQQIRTGAFVSKVVMVAASLAVCFFLPCRWPPGARR